ncbi:MAG: ParB N-terminal domain-containing protein [Oscillospiraceae bacterium]|jgi:ParB family chromosome partitioning protein|nr:ParB N-terminal domain-containing protein [Oscillospiraceae bacterium]
MPAATRQTPRLKNLDELFRLNDGVDPLDVPTEKNSSIYNGMYSIVPFSLMDDFPEHPFRLYNGERASDMVDSIRSNGILQPLILHDMNNGRYQILSGHNRKCSGMKAGLMESPAIVKKNLTDDEARMYVIETNLIQRSFTDMSHSEKAAIIATQHSKLFSQGKRNDILAELQMLEKPHEHRETRTAAQVAHRLKSRDIVAQEYGLSKDMVARYLRIYKLIPALKIRLDNGEIAFLTAVTLSFLKESEQDMLDKCLELNRFSVDMKKADILRDYSEKNKLNGDSIYLILTGEIRQKPKPNRTPTVKVSKTLYAKYFSPNQPATEIQTIVEKALDFYFSHQQ